MFDYNQKYKSYLKKTLFDKLKSDQKEFISGLAFRFRFTFQEFRQAVEAERDLNMWGEPGLQQWWSNFQQRNPVHTPVSKKFFLTNLHNHFEALKQSEKQYPPVPATLPNNRSAHPVVLVNSRKKISGLCPVASDKTVCCQLRTIDAIENCVYGCSYCTIQTFYTSRTVVNLNLPAHLAQLEIRPDRYYHFGSGQASDSLALGNIHGILDDLCKFASRHPNILMEFKTKSNNIEYFLQHDIPPNVVCSWSLNPEIIIANEEYLTASLSERLTAARAVADRGLKVAFHFHPMIYYRGWDTAYTEVADRLMQQFQSREVLFLSFGTLTLIKPVIRQIRSQGLPTRALQMEMVADPHGKLTYSDSIKVKMFTSIYRAFAPWQDRVFMYLCMEKAAIWKQVFGRVYQDNADFEQDFLNRTIGSIYKLS